MTTYTIATIDDMLIATVPDGEDIAAAVRAYEETYMDEPGKHFEDYDVQRGLTLTDESPEDSDQMVWDAHTGVGGFLMVETPEGTQTFKYAVRS